MDDIEMCLQQCRGREYGGGASSLGIDIDMLGATAESLNPPLVGLSFNDLHKNTSWSSEVLLWFHASDYSPASGAGLLAVKYANNA